MTDDNQKEFDDNNDIELEDIDSDFENEFDDIDAFDDEFNDGEIIKKSNNKSIIFGLIILILIAGAGYFFLGKALSPNNKTQQNSSPDFAISIPPAPTVTNMTENAASIPLPPPPMPTPIGPDSGSDEIIAGTDITPTIVEEVADTPDDFIEDMQPPAVVNTQETNNIVPDAVAEVDAPETPLDPVVDGADTGTVIEAINDNLAEEASLQESNQPADLVTEEELMPVATPTPVVVSKAVSTNNIETDQRIEALEANIQALVARLENVTDTADQAETTELVNNDKDKLDTLSQQMLQVTHRLDQLSEKITELSKKPKAAAPKAKTVTKKAPKKAAVKVAPKPKKTITSSSSWVLRSAQPGVAWLSKGKTSEMQRYSVGQNVSGFGVIQSVSQENGRWVVRSKNGAIKQ